MSDTTFKKFVSAMGRAVDGPVTWWRGNFSRYLSHFERH